MKLLAIQSGIFGDQSNSTHLVNVVVEQLKENHAEIELTTRNLTANPLPYFDAGVAMALNSAEVDRTDAQQEIVSLSDQLISEVTGADAIVLGLPMYNFGVPAQMKSWFDLLARAGVTFTYGANGPEGLIADKPVFVVAARGGQHQGQISDSQTPFVKTILGFLGLKDVRIAYAEGLNMGEESKTESLKQFRFELADLI